jgi:hypothetical protein
MLKAGLISGGVMFVLVLFSAAVISPLCALCVPFVVGLLAGYLTGVFEKTPATVVNRGALAGAIAGGVGVLAQIGAAIINAAIMQDPSRQINNLLGLPTADPATVWIAQLGMAMCVGLLNVGLSAGLGAGGGAIWKGSAGKVQIQPPAEPLPPTA